MKTFGVEVGYNYGGGVENAVSNINDDFFAEVIFIEVDSLHKKDKKTDIISLSIEQAEEVVSQLNRILNDIYDEQKKK